MRILVTGAAGFIGSHLVKQLSLENHEVIALDALIETTYSKEIKISRWELLENQGIQLEVRDLRYDNIDDLVDKSDVIVNLAAMPGLKLSWENFTMYQSCNIDAVQKLIQSILKFENKRLIHISSSSVYGEFAVGDESSPIQPISPYGVTKYAAELLLQAYAKNFPLNFSVLRYFSVYGPGQRQDMAYSKFIDGIYSGNVIDVYGDGTQERSNTFISDCVRGTIDAIPSAKNGLVYNVSGTFSISINEAIAIIEKELGKKAKINFLPAVAGDQRKTLGDSNRALTDFKYRPGVSPKDGLQKQVQAYLSNSLLA